MIRHLTLATGIVAMFVGLAGADQRDANRVDPNEPITLPHVGLTVSMPPGFRLSPASPGALLLGTRRIGRRGVEVISVAALSRKGISGRVDPRAFSEGYVVGLQESTNLKDPNILSSKAHRVAGQDGWRITVSLSGGTRKVTISGTSWWKRSAESNVTICYTLTVMVPGTDPKRAAAVADVVCESVKLGGLNRPSNLPMPPLLGPVSLKAEGVSVRIPLGWMLLSSGRRPGTPVVLRAGAIDYLGNLSIPNVNMTVLSTRPAGVPDLTDPGVLQRYGGQLKRMIEGRPGWSKAKAAKSKLAGRPGIEMSSHVRIRNNDCVQVLRQAFHNGKVYTLTLTWDGKDRKRALAAMERIAAGVEFLEPAAAATTGPATQRAVTP